MTAVQLHSQIEASHESTQLVDYLNTTQSALIYDAAFVPGSSPNSSREILPNDRTCMKAATSSALPMQSISRRSVNRAASAAASFSAGSSASRDLK